MDILPQDATDATHRRYELAVTLVESCSLTLGRAIALTGSVARGTADEDSDIELNCWVDVLPSAGDRISWLRTIGARDVMLDSDAIADGSLWVTCQVEGTWIEIGWQTVEAQETLLEAILAGQVTDRGRLVVASILTQAVALRGSDVIMHWQQALADYPAVLQARLIAAATEVWTFPHLLVARWALIQRGDQFALAQRLVSGVQDALRILYAVNRRWEPYEKWTELTIDTLPIKPERLAKRINEIFMAPQPAERLAVCLTLIRDTLALVPPPYDVARAIATIDESLRIHGA